MLYSHLVSGIKYLNKYDILFPEIIYITVILILYVLNYLIRGYMDTIFRLHKAVLDKQMTKKRKNRI